MAKYDLTLDRVFSVFSDASRRAMVERLVRGPASVSELADAAGITLPSTHGHLAKLDAAGLIETQKTGRTRVCRLHPMAFTAARRWLAEQEAQWQGRLDRFDAYATELSRKHNHDPGS